MTERELQEAGWVPVGKLEELADDGTGKTVEEGGEAYAVFRVGERVHVLQDTCPHEGASLGCGVLSRGEVTCPWHGWHFDLEAGQSTDGLPERLKVYETRVQPSGEVWARLGSQ
jgi:nitrite reductase/ring-hydroxylating ferredoxin subunit